MVEKGSAIRVWARLVAVVSMCVLIWGCDPCEDGSAEFLMLGVGISNGTTGASLAPTWGEVWHQPVDEGFVASAIWGPDDPRPGRGLFEFWDVTDEPAFELESTVTRCSTSDVDPGGACAIPRETSCGFEGFDWRPAFEFELEKSYALILRPDEGNGRELSTPGEPEPFQGEPALVMPIETAREVRMIIR